MTEAEMDQQDQDYQVTRIDALERAVAALTERCKLQSKALVVLRGVQRDDKAECARWIAEATQEMDERVRRVESRSDYLMLHS